jgi:hypothetical protein
VHEDTAEFHVKVASRRPNSIATSRGAERVAASPAISSAMVVNGAPARAILIQVRRFAAGVTDDD